MAPRHAILRGLGIMRGTGTAERHSTKPPSGDFRHYDIRGYDIRGYDIGG